MTDEKKSVHRRAKAEGDLQQLKKKRDVESVQREKLRKEVITVFFFRFFFKDVFVLSELNLKNSWFTSRTCISAPFCEKNPTRQDRLPFSLGGVFIQSIVWYYVKQRH